MQRSPEFASPNWKDPFWHVARMLVDIVKGASKYALEIQPNEIVPLLKKKGTAASLGLIGYLETRPHQLEVLSAYWSKRGTLSKEMLEMMRLEEDAKADYTRLTDREPQIYGVQNAGHHKSPKVLVNTVDAIVQAELLRTGARANLNPQSRAATISDKHIWVSPRRLDGAVPDLLNPIGIWEVKEYWGKTNGGSKMSDAIYEIQLVGTELRMFEDEHHIHVRHYAILDGKEQWTARQSDMRRAIDLLYAGLLDELIIGSEVLTEWPRIVEELCAASLQNPDLPTDTGNSDALF